MLLRFVNNSKRSTFNDESITGESFRTTAQTAFRVSVTKNFFEILIDHRSYLYKFYSKSFKIWWTDRLKMALNLKVYQFLLGSMHEKIACARVFSASACGAKKN